MSNKRYSFGVIGFHPEDNYIQDSVSEDDTRFSFGLLAFTPKKLYMGLRLSEFYARFSFGLMVFTPKNNYIWDIGYLSLMQDPPFGLLAFTPKRHSIWASTINVLCRILSRVIGLHPEAKHGYIWKWSYFGLMEFYLAFGIDWFSVIGVLDNGALKRLSLFVKWRGEPSAHCKWMPLGEMSPGLAKLSGPQHPLVSVLNFS